MILFFIVLVLLGINILIHGLRIIYVNKLYSLYDRLENTIIENKLTPNKELTTFLKIHKNVIFNNQVLDIWFLLKRSINIKRDESYYKVKNNYNEYFNSLPKNVRAISISINKKQDFVVMLSVLKPINFMIVCTASILTLTLAIIFKIFKYFGIVLNTIAKLPRAVKDIFYTEENFIIQKDYFTVYS